MDHEDQGIAMVGERDTSFSNSLPLRGLEKYPRTKDLTGEVSLAEVRIFIFVSFPYFLLFSYFDFHLFINLDLS